MDAQLTKLWINLKVARNTVRLWIRKADGNVEDKKRTGRPVRMTPNSKATVKVVLHQVFFFFNGFI